MNLMSFKRPFVYFLLLALLALSIKVRQDVVIKGRNKEIISSIIEWEKHGKPVDVIKVSKSDFFVFKRISIMQVDGNRYRAYVTKNEKSYFKAGQDLYYHADSSDYCGVITAVAEEIDMEKGLYPIEIELRSESKSFASREIIFAHTSTVEGIIQIPQDALELKDDLKSQHEFNVKKIVDGKVILQAVTVGEVDHDFLQISNGLDLGDLVVVNGQTLVNEGDRVAIRKEIVR